MTIILEPPDGCMEIGGYILVVTPGKEWLTQEGEVTGIFSKRGVWDTPEEAMQFLVGFNAPVSG